MSRILCTELDYRAVNIFHSGQSLFLGLSQVIGPVQNCVVICVSVYFYISDSTRYNSCCFWGFHAVGALNLILTRADLEMPLPTIAVIAVLEYCQHTCYLFWLVYCLLPIRDSVKDIHQGNICSCWPWMSAVPKQPLQTEIFQASFLANAFGPCSEMFTFHSPVDYHLWG